MHTNHTTTTGAPAPMAQRVINARAAFVASVGEQFGIKPEIAEAALTKYLQLRIAHIDKQVGRVVMHDGRFWDAEIIRRAATA
jgi:hypothetical protein